MQEQTRAAVPLGQLAVSDEIAGAALFLASDESSYVNGARHDHDTPYQSLVRGCGAAHRPLGPPARRPLTLTMLGSLRSESVPRSATNILFPGLPSLSSPTAGFRQSTRSGYAELRAPLLARDGNMPFLRGLELQVAIRFDAQKTIVPPQSGGSDFRGSWADGTPPASSRLHGGPAPLSLAVDNVAREHRDRPPPAHRRADKLLGKRDRGNDAFGNGDPKRGGRLIGTEGEFSYLAGGSPSLRSERAQSLPAGIVLNPDGRRGPRVSLDVTHIDKHGEISTVYSSNLRYFISNEALYPDRIGRVPLTADDIAAGYRPAGSAGSIRALNGGQTSVDALDLQVDWEVPTAVGAFSARTKVTWEPRLERRKPWSILSAPRRTAFLARYAGLGCRSTHSH